MPKLSTVRRVLVRLGRLAFWLAVFAIGWWLLVRPAVHIFGEHLKDLWVYQSRDAHRFTAMSMLQGSLRYHDSLVSLVGDEEVYNGAGYTHWGYGVPLLQIPFHAIARHMASLPARFFPDRAIFFAYLTLTAAVLWAGIDRLLALRERAGASRLRRRALSWAAALYVLCTGLYPSIAAHFHVYDETIAYFVMIELVAMSAYVFMVGSEGWMPVVALAVAAGMGLLTRPTGAILLAMWSGIVVFERRSMRAASVFVGAAAPFVVFWLFTNWVRTGYPWSVGFQNSLPGAEHVQQVRFGSLCVDGWAHTKQVARDIFGALFMIVPHDAGLQQSMKDCGLKFEARTDADAANEPYLGTGVLLFLVWTLLHHVFRRERRPAVYAPYAAMACVFGIYVYAGAGLAWRYVGDFLPLVFLVGIQYVRVLPAAASSLLGWPLAAVLFTGAYSSYKHYVAPTKKQVEEFDTGKVAHMWQDFESTRSGRDKSLPSKLHCDKSLDWPRFTAWWRKNLSGWEHDCTVGDVTELFLGVPAKNDDSYVVRLKTDGMVTDHARLYVNGRTYTAWKVGDAYEATARIRYASLSSPTVLVSIEWKHSHDPVQGKLLDIEIR